MFIFTEVACDHAEGGMYIGPEFQLGQVYDGSAENGDSIVLYRPVYLSVVSQGLYCFVFSFPVMLSVVLSITLVSNIKYLFGHALVNSLYNAPTFLVWGSFVIYFC